MRHWNHKARLTTEFKKDITWWIRFAAEFNGKAKLLHPVPITMPLFECDSSFSGFGIYYNGDWRAGVWHPDTHVYPPDIKHLPQWITPSTLPAEVLGNINLLELYPVLLACQLWGFQWRDKRVIVFTDNTQVQAIINTGRSRSGLAMTWLRDMFWCSAKYNFHLTARRISSKANIIADRLSRLAHPCSHSSLTAFLCGMDISLPFFNDALSV